MKSFPKIVLGLALLMMCNVAEATVNIVPKPVRVTEKEGQFTVKSGQTIAYNDAELAPAAGYLKRILTRATGLKITTKQGKGTINLTLLTPGDNLDESYTLEVTPQGINVNAFSYKGIVNGIATIRQLLPNEIESRTVVKDVAWTVPAIEVFDKPQFEWRGLHVDPVRHFLTVEETERIIDQMALYKLNKLHWHIIDSQGWRIEIKKYPLLTTKGAWRQHNPGIDDACLNRAKAENNPDFLLPKKNYKVINGDSLYGGFYTQDQIREVVRFAAVRGIDVVPEIDMPGHNSIAQACYPFLTCNGGITDVYCLGKETTIEFAKNVWKEVFDLFPYEYAHIGGDEANRAVWNSCKDCQARLKNENLKGVEELQAWFTRTMEQYFNEHGRKLMGWDEILEGGVTPTATVYWWRGDHTDVVQKSTNMGNQVVLCPTTYCYFDYPQDNNTIQRLYTGTIVPKDLSSAQLKLIKGMQANTWSEFIPSEARWQFMTFPRVLALAEQAWTPEENRSWDDFKARLNAQTKRLDVMKINYRPLETNKP